MSKMIFVNLPVNDLAAATAFYEAIGCVKNEQFSNESAASLVWSDEIYFMLLTRPFFSTFTSRPLGDSHAAVSVLIALSFDSREAVDAITEASGRGGGKPDVRPAMDHGWMYSRAFEDVDGHIIEAVWMDMAGLAAMGGDPAAT